MIRNPSTPPRSGWILGIFFASPQIINVNWRRDSVVTRTSHLFSPTSPRNCRLAHQPHLWQSQIGLDQAQVHQSLKWNKLTTQFNNPKVCIGLVNPRSSRPNAVYHIYHLHSIRTIRAQSTNTNNIKTKAIRASTRRSWTSTRRTIIRFLRQKTPAIERSPHKKNVLRENESRAAQEEYATREPTRRLCNLC